MLFPALEREELLPLPLLLDSGQRCLDPPPESMGAFGRLFAFLHAFAHPAPAAAEALRRQCGGGTAELWLQCGGGGVRLWLSTLARVFEDETVGLVQSIEWMESEDAALAAVLASLWRLALETPRDSVVEKPALHSALRSALAQPRGAGRVEEAAALRLLRDARGQAAEERAQAAARPPKQRPNDLCRCGSGKKHKKCCMNKRSV